MNAFNWSLLLTALGFVLGWIFHWLLRRSRWTQTTRRLVETSTDESTKLSQFADGHASELGTLRDAHDAELATVRDEHGRALALVEDHKREIETHRNEAGRLQGLVGTLQPLERKHFELEKTVAAERADRERLALEWRTKADTAEAARVKAVGDVTAAHAERDRAITDWRVKFEAAENARTKLASEVAAAKAENDRILADWRTRAETAEKARLALAGDLETAHKKHEEVSGALRLKAEASEKLVADERRAHETALAQLRTDRDAAGAVWKLKHDETQASHIRVQGLLDSSKVSGDEAAVKQDRLIAEWRTKYETTESARAKLTDAAAQATTARDASLTQQRTDFEARLASERADHERVLAETRSAHLRDTNTLKAQGDDVSTRFATLTGQHAQLKDSHDEHARHRAEQESELVSLRTQLAEATAGPDDLLVIEGIGPKINTALNAAGIRRFAHVRDATQGQMRAALEGAGINFAPSITSWSKQAQFLAAGDIDGFRSYADYLVAGQDPKLAPLEEGDIEVIPAGSAESGAIRVLASGQDDLIRIEGIGPVIDTALRTAGITTFAELSQSADERLRNALEAAGLRFAPSLATWAEQARLLADGDEAAFAKYTEFLVAGRDPSKANT